MAPEGEPASCHGNAEGGGSAQECPESSSIALGGVSASVSVQQSCRGFLEFLLSQALSESLVVCDVAEDLVEKLRKFRFRKETNNAAIIMKIDKDKQLVVLDEEHEGISPDELKDELPERQPRFIVYSYKYQHEDGRVSYPLCFIFSSPVGCKPEQQMMYAGSKNKLVQTAELTKVFEIRNTEDLTEEWLREKLGFFH
ncbi:glia maturation factor beta [Sylvia borin]